MKNKKLNVFFLLFVFISKGENKEEKTKNKLEGATYANLGIRGPYSENTTEALQHYSFIGNNIWCLGTIDDIKWNLKIVPLEEIQKTFEHFTIGKPVDFFILISILLFLKEQLDLKYQFVLEYNKEKPGAVIVKIEEKKNKKYVVKKINISGFDILKEREVREKISPAITEINMIEKLKFLFLGRSGAVITNDNIQPIVEKFIKEFTESKLLPNAKVFVEIKKNSKNNDAEVYIKIEEGQKYFIEKIIIDKEITKNPKFKRKFLELWLEKNGRKDGNFDEVKKNFFYPIGIFDLKTSYIEERNSIFLSIKKNKDNEEGHSIDMINYIGFFENDIDINFLTKNLYKYGIFLKGSYNEERLENFVNEVSNILQSNVTYKIQKNISGNVVIIITNEKKNEKKNEFLNFQDGKIKFQYEFFNRLDNIPNFSIDFTPKISVSTYPEIALDTKISYRLYKFVVYLVIWEFLLKTDKIKDMEWKEILKRAFFHKISIYQMEKKSNNYCINNADSFDWTFCPISILNEYKREDKIHTYYYPKGSINVRSIIPSIENLKINNFISTKIFLENFIVKGKLRNELAYKITDEFQLYFSATIVPNTKGKMESFDNYFSSINSSDNMYCILWPRYYEDEDLKKILETNNILDDTHISSVYYVLKKDVIVANFILNLKFFAHYTLLKFSFPGVGKIRVSFCVFFNKTIDSHKIHKNSCGFGLMGVLNNKALLLSIGKKISEKNISNGISYGISLDEYSF